MLIELDGIPGADTESYNVRMVEDDKEGQHIAVGIVRRIGDDAWSFTPNGRSEDEEVTVRLQAKDVEELRGVFRTRFGSIEIEPDRLRDATMTDFADAVLVALQALAARTDTSTGFVRALARSFAHIIAEDVKPDKEAEFRKVMLDDIDHNVNSIRRQRALRDAMLKTMRGMFKDRDDGEESNGTTKH